jgi:hypothetical protein
MENKEHENMFKFGLYQDDETIIETLFSADVFNPVVRYSVDIREDIFSIIVRLQKALSRRNISHKIDFGQTSYDFLEYYKNLTEIEHTKLNGKPFNEKLKLKKRSNQTVNGKTYTGIQFKFGLYINNNPIVERDFYVEGYNPSSRFSIELSETVDDIAQEINLKLKNQDISHMWDDYDLIYAYGLHINQIREFSNKRRDMMLEKIGDPNFIKNTKRNDRTQN